jgi:hypothetical protein
VPTMHMGGRVRKAPRRAPASSSYDTVSYVPADGSPSRQQGRPPTYVRARALIVRRVSVFRALCRQRKMCRFRQPETIRSSPGRTPKLQVARFPARRTIRDCTARRATFSRESILLRGRLRRIGRSVSPEQGRRRDSSQDCSGTSVNSDAPAKPDSREQSLR